MTFRDDYVREARFILLRSIAASPAGALRASLLMPELERAGFYEPMAFVLEQLNHLVRVGAIALQDRGGEKVAFVLPHGEDHLKRRVEIEGVKRPSALAAFGVEMITQDLKNRIGE